MKHTGFITDIGMTGAYNSVIGINKDQSVNSFVNKKAQKKNLNQLMRIRGAVASLLTLSLKLEHVNKYLEL